MSGFLFLDLVVNPQPPFNASWMEADALSIKGNANYQLSQRLQKTSIFSNINLIFQNHKIAHNFMGSLVLCTISERQVPGCFFTVSPVSLVDAF